MKIVYVKDTNALEFDKQNKQNTVFAKYFSPGCPACIAMESEWDDMCKDIDNKYNTDLILAQIDPTGMSKLEKTATYSDVDYVPSIVILKNGKKVAEYDGPKNKDNMIEFLLKGGYVKHKMKGGSKKSKRRKSKSKRRKRKNTRRNRKGSGASMSKASINKNKKSTVDKRDKDDFNFVENKRWFKPFLVALNNYFDTSHTITYMETQDFAIRNVDKVFRPKGFVTTPAWEYRADWIECPRKQSIELNSNCRESRGFGNRHVPNSRKFNPKYNNLKSGDVRLKNDLKLAKDSYEYLKYMKEIDIIVRTPSSDYTRFSSEGDENKKFMENMREIQSGQDIEDPYTAILETYGYDKPVSIEELKQVHQETKKLMDETHDMIDGRLSKESIAGGKKSRRKRGRKRKLSKKRKLSRKH